MKYSNLKWWQIGLAALATSAVGGLSSMKKKRAERKVFTNEFKQAPWAPPAMAFGPVWTLNNYFVLRALQRLIKSDHQKMKMILRLQIPIWAIFFSFGYVYFNRKSPVLAAVWTVADAALAGISFGLARKRDSALANHYLPLLAWTTFASSLAIYQALKNDDPVLLTKAVA